MRVGITGATGLIGTALYQSLVEDSHDIVAFVRSPDKAAKKLPAAERVSWEATSGPPPPGSLSELDAIVHLAGEPVAEQPWSERRKKAIRTSRVLGTENLVRALAQSDRPPRVLINGSAVGYYGPRQDELLDETSSPGDDFLAETCIQWEAAAREATSLGIRVVLLRTGIVLSTAGGALPRMLLPFRMFVGGPIGSGEQWMSWVHLQDEVGAIRHALDSEQIEGPINVTAPNPVTNREFSNVLAGVLGRPAFFRVPGFVLRLVFGEMAETILLQGQCALPKRLESAGYRFRFPQLPSALQNLLD